MTFAADVAAQEARATALLATAVTYLNEVQLAANTILIAGTTVLPEQYNYASVPAINFPVLGATRPDIGSLEFGAPPEAPTLGFASIAPVVLPDDDLLAPTAVFEFAEDPYVSTLLDAQKAKLLDNLLNGGYGIETADEIALFNRARDREVEAMLSRVEDANRALAARGFALPPDTMQVHTAAAYQEMQDKTSSASRDITLRRSELFVDNRKFTITEVRGLETVLMNYWNSVQERSLNAAKATLELSVLIYNYVLERYRTRMAGAKITADVNIATAQLDVERARASLEIFRSQVLAYEWNLRRVLDPARLEVDLYRTDVDAARMANDASIARTNMQTRAIEATTTQNTDISRMTIENARVRLLGIVESIKFRTEAAAYGSKEYFAQLSSLLSTINTLSVETGERA